MSRPLFGILTIFALALAAPSWGNPENTEKKDPEKSETVDNSKDAKDSGAKPVRDLKRVVESSVEVGGVKVDYEAETNTITLFDEKGKRKAEVFYVYYRRTGVDQPVERPIVFCFNGGPGSSAVWLHLGGLGPKRVVLPDDGLTLPSPPFRVEDSADTVLDAADLVFVDPVSTGFSRADDPGQAGRFHGFREDVGYLADFIRRFVDEHERWASPKFLLGESYGALRVTGLADELQSRTGMYLNGVVLLSGLLDFRTILTANGNDLPFSCFLPAMTATAHFHGRIDGGLEQLVAEARDFAFGEYAKALLAGNNLPPAETERIAARLAALTGLPAETWQAARLRIDPTRFRKLLLADEEMQVGRFDSRVKAPSINPLDSNADRDPSFDVVWGPFASTINDYLRRDLRARTTEPYEVLNPVGPWNMAAENRFLGVDDRLTAAMRRNPHLRVLVQAAYHDLATPPDGITHSVSQINLPQPLRSNIKVEYYEGGHMFYTNRPASAKMRRDLLRFFQPTP